LQQETFPPAANGAGLDFSRGGETVNDLAAVESAGDDEVFSAPGILQERRGETGDAGDVAGQIAGGAEDSAVIVRFDKDGDGILAVAENEGVRSGGVNQGELGQSRAARPEQGSQEEPGEGDTKSKHGTNRIHGAIEPIFRGLRNTTEIIKTELILRGMKESIISAFIMPTKEKRVLVAPDFFMAALRKNKKALATYEAYSYSHKKEYVEWVAEAKREETRQKRLEKTVAWLAEGKSRK